MKNKENYQAKNPLHWLYAAGFFVILALPLLSLPPWFYPADFAKTIIFRSIVTLLLCLFAWQFFYQRSQLQLPPVKKNGIFWLLIALFGTFLLATLFSIDPYFSLWGSPARAGGFINFSFYIIFALLAFFLIKKEDWQKAWDFSLVIGGLVSIAAMIEFLQSHARPIGTVGNTDLLAGYLLLLFFMAAAFLFQESVQWKKICYGSAAALFLLVIFLTQVRGAFLGLFIAAIYGLFFYGKKYWRAKSAVAIISIIIIALVFFLHAPGQHSRFSLSSILSDQRFAAWHIGWNAFLAKPIAGWGPENFGTAFATFYDPIKIPYVPNTPFANWWDRGHNIVVDLGVQTGVLGLAAYIALMAYALYRLQKAKSYLPEKKALLHGIQAALIAYLTANMFSFDSFSTYLIYFLIIGYILRSTETPATYTFEPKTKKIWHGFATAGIFCAAAIFLWQYNLYPLYVNARINTSEIQADQKSCDQMVTTMDETTKSSTFLDVYARLKYVDFLTTCDTSNPQNDVTYAKKGVEIMQEAVKIQPTYARLWLFLGSFTNIIASHESDLVVKKALVKEANEYLNKADQLAPRHQEILIEKAWVALTDGDYETMKTDANACIALNSDTGDCYFQLALAEIYLKDSDAAKQSLTEAGQKQYSVESATVLNKLVDAYAAVNDYEGLATTYEKLVALDLNNAQYRASLAFVYRALGRYKEARVEVADFLRLAPDQKAEADAFLKTLPPQ